MIPTPLNVVDLEKIRAIESFDQFFEFVLKNPRKAKQLVIELASTDEAYPTSAGVYYLMGIFAGILTIQPIDIYGIRKQREALEAIIEAHKDYGKLRPADYMGSKRVCGKTGNFPPPKK